jgi:anti-sigma regulatory factor (Ser/Thr protein kinase)
LTVHDGDYVNDPVHLSLELPTEPDSIPRARRAIEEVGPTVDDLTMLNLRLLVSELVTNAVRHVPADQAAAIRLSVQRTEDVVRVEVADRGPGFTPQPNADVKDRASGWGLNILAKVADRWGVENDDGALVWFEVDAPAPPGA